MTAIVTEEKGRMHSERVGFIGLGVMGSGMAANLAKAGFGVVAVDPSPAAQEAAAAHGIELAPTPREAAAAATRTVVSVVRTAEQTREVLLGPDGVAAARRKDLDVVVMSTLDPSTMRALASELAERGITALDATLSGGSTGAAAGTLTIMVSGEKPVVERIWPVLEAMGTSLFHVGTEIGTAQAAKLAVQLSFGVGMLGAFEAMRLATSYGVDEDQLMEILSLSVGDSWVTRNWRRVRGWWEHYVPGEDLDILLKDMRAMLREGDERVVGLPVTALSFQRMRHAWSEPPHAGD
jgi:3-hydroxyisobutyrate dehydrogenase-like beta-hydroxyacid dehydrogenase